MCGRSSSFRRKDLTLAIILVMYTSFLFLLKTSCLWIFEVLSCFSLVNLLFWLLIKIIARGKEGRRGRRKRRGRGEREGSRGSGSPGFPPRPNDPDVQLRAMTAWGTANHRPRRALPWTGRGGEERAGERKGERQGVRGTQGRSRSRWAGL